MSEISKRTFLKAAAMTGLMASTATEAASADGTREPLIDRDRASFLLATAGLDGLLLGRPESTYHATGTMQAMSRFGVPGTTFALLPRDRRAPVVHIVPQFGFYYMIADTGVLPGVEQRLVTGTGDDGRAASAAMYMMRDSGAISAREAGRRRATEAEAPFFASSAAALADAMRGMGKSPRIGHDTMEAAELLAIAAPGAVRRPAGDIARHIRLVRTPREIELMRAASAANVEAALTIAPQMRALGSLQAVRNAFNSHVSTLGNVPVFMAVDGVVDEGVQAEFVDGQTALIDCVSQRAGYHGDFGRTIFIGEPAAPALKNARLVAAAWEEVRAGLRPGLRFSQVRAMGTDALARMGSDLRVPFQPHCVGLAHTDQPQFGLNGEPIDLVLEAGMTISVDCPVMEVGTSGTMHMEDLTLITPDGSAPLHAAAQPFIMA
jgi:Xaa-Pro aminopeptidase